MSKRAFMWTAAGAVAAGSGNSGSKAAAIDLSILEDK